MSCIVIITVLTVVLLLGMIVFFALPAITSGEIYKIFSLTWAPKQGFLGIIPMIIGSFLLAFFSLIIGWPLSIGVCLWMLSRRSNSCIVKGMKFFIRSMTAIPTVVYGFAAIFLLIPFVRNVLGGSGFSLCSAGIILALLIVPTMVLVMDAGLQPRLDRLCPEGLAIGFSRLELLWFFIIPYTPRVIVTAAVIGFGRALGDTLIALMLSGNTPQIPHSFSDGFRVITAHIAFISANEVGGSTYNALFLAGFLLLSINVFIGFCLRTLGRSNE